MTKTIPIFFTFNNDYSVPAAVAIFSLLNKAKENVFYKMYVLHSDITKESEKTIAKSIQKFKNFSLEYINIENFLKDEWQNKNWLNQNKGNKFVRETIIKCFAPSYFKEYDKIIFSDVDVVFNDDISELIDINLEDNYIAAVKDFLLKYSDNEIYHLPKKYFDKLKDTFFAAGILVMNLKKMREDKIEDKILNLINDDSLSKRGMEQDLLNIACNNKVKYIPLNYIGYPYIEDYILKPDFKSHYTKEEMYDSIINPKIFHYASQKPWNSTTKYSEHWWVIFRYLNLPKTKIFNKNISKNKTRNKNILSGILLILISLPIITKFFSSKNKAKLYKSIEKYKDI